MNDTNNKGNFRPSTSVKQQAKRTLCATKALQSYSNMKSELLSIERDHL